MPACQKSVGKRQAVGGSWTQMTLPVIFHSVILISYKGDLIPVTNFIVFPHGDCNGQKISVLISLPRAHDWLSSSAYRSLLFNMRGGAPDLDTQLKLSFRPRSSLDLSSTGRKRHPTGLEVRDSSDV